MDVTTKSQVRVIHRVADALSAVGVRAWLFGGWGLDARVGQITRDHGDIEFWVERSDAARSKAALVDAGATALSTQPPECPPRQVAVLVLRDVLGFHAREVAAMLDATVESVNSALKRARAGLQRRWPLGADLAPPPALDSPAEDAIVAKFARAWESADLDGLVSLLTDDVFISMPPMPFEYEGRDLVARFCAGIFGAGRSFDLVLTRANGQPALGAYQRAPGGVSHGTGLFVLTLTGDRIRAMTRFENSVLPRFGLPPSLPSR